jgi:hypothetical protein
MRIGVAAILLASAFLAIYLPDVGHGFVKDDFAWIEASRVTSWEDARSLFTSNVGFYRPLVSATFAADHAFWRLNAYGYGITNIALVLAGAALLYSLARTLKLPPPAALVATAVWAFNFHGVNMAVLWLSGRTALLLVVFSLATAHAALRHRWLAAGALCLCAMLCKEEAVLLPPMWAVFAALDARDGTADGRPATRILRALLATAPLWVAGIVYAILRSQSGAFVNADAPDYYRFTIDPSVVARNLAEYVDRAGTVAAAIVIALLTASRSWRAGWSGDERRAAMLGVLWFAAGYGLTMFLPLRSSLYALMPSIGCALLAGTAAARALRARPVAFARTCAVLVGLAIVLNPVYRTRNVRWSAAADLSSELRARMETIAARYPDGGTVLLEDDVSRRINFSATFDTQFPKAATLFMGPKWNGEIAGQENQPPQGRVVRIQLSELANSER